MLWNRDDLRIRVRYLREVALYLIAVMVLPLRFIFNWWDRGERCPVTWKRIELSGVPPIVGKRMASKEGGLKMVPPRQGVNCVPCADSRRSSRSRPGGSASW